MIGFLGGSGTTGSSRAYQLYTRHHAKTFYFASHVLPRDKRRAAYAVYAFCRYADNIVDSAGRQTDKAEASGKLQQLREQLVCVYTNPAGMDPQLGKFRETVLQYDIPHSYFADLLRGVEMDLTRKRYATFAELDEYCYCVASVVGLIMTRIFGTSDLRAYEHAAHLGTAMQLTNILRDVREDYRMGRIYLPADEMRQFGCSEADLSAKGLSDNLRNLIAFQVDRARGYYASAAEGIPMLTNDGSRFCVRLMSRTYGHILDVIAQRNYDVLSGRAFVPGVTKLRIAAGVVLGLGDDAQRALGSHTLYPMIAVNSQKEEHIAVP